MKRYRRRLHAGSDEPSPRNGVAVAVVSPSTQGGSWRWIEECVELAGVWSETQVIAYGKRTHVPIAARWALVLPWISYEKVALWLARHIWVIPFYNVPLVIVAYGVILLRRPRIIVANGLLLGAALAPLQKVLNCQVVVAYHSYSSHFSPRLRRALGRLLADVRVAFVNSYGSEVDLATVIESGRIKRVEHWAHNDYFGWGRSRAVETQRAMRDLRVLYVGRLDDEKARFLLDVVSLCADDPIMFTVVGDGPLVRAVELLASAGLLSYEGYVADRRHLAELYVAHDILWGVADLTYVAKPVVEALACGTSTVIPDRPAVDAVTDASARIGQDLLPAPVGFIVDGEDPSRARGVLLNVHKADRTAWPGACRAYAAERYSAANAIPVIEILRDGA